MFHMFPTDTGPGSTTSYRCMGVSKNNATPKSSIFIGFSINHPFWGTPIFGNTRIVILQDVVARRSNQRSRDRASSAEDMEKSWHPKFLPKKVCNIPCVCLNNCYSSLSQWPNFKLFGITYLVGKIKFKLFFSGSIG